MAELTFPQLRNAARQGKAEEDPHEKRRAALATLRAFKDGEITF